MASESRPIRLSDPIVPLDAEMESSPTWLAVASGSVELYAQPYANDRLTGPRRFLGALPTGTLLPRVTRHARWRLWLTPSEPGALTAFAWPTEALSAEQAERFALNFAPLIQSLRQIESPAAPEPELASFLMRPQPAAALQDWIHARLDILSERRAPLELADATAADRAARHSALIRMAAVLEPTAAPQREEARSLAALASRVAQAQGIVLREGAEKPFGREDIHAWAQRANVRLRRVALRDPWWREEGAPLLAFTEEGKKPVALLPQAGRGYRYCSAAQSAADASVDPAFARTLAPFAYSMHGRLPDTKIVLADMLKFGWRGALGDASVMLAALVAAGVFGATLPAAVAYMFQTVIPSSEPGLLIDFVGVIVLLTLVGGVLRLTSDLASLRIEGRLGNGLQSAFFDRLLRLPLSFFAGMTSGDLSNRLATVDMVRRNFSRVLTQLATSLFFTLGAFGTMMYFMPKAAWIAGAVLLTVWVASGVLAWRQVRTLYEGEQIEGNIIALAVQLIQGIAKLRLAGAEDRAFGLWGRGFAEMRSRLVRSQRLQAWSGTLFAVAEVALTATVFAVLGYTDDAASKPTIGEFLALVAALATFSGSGLSLGRAVAAAITIKPFAERVRPLMNAEPESAVAGGGAPHTLKGGLEVVRLNFRYSEQGPWILRDVSFVVRPGEFVALVGASGCGKTTLMRQLLAFEKPVSGGIFFDGRDLAGLDPMALRRQMGVVLQNARTMPGSLFENISVAHDCSLDEAWEAVRMAGLEDDIRAMPMGMHTVLSEGNAALSGGQVQRLLLARALAGKPRLLFLDEATSALDNRTQAAVTEALAGVAATRLVIAHRLSTVKNANIILVMHEGRIVESGKYDDLMVLDGHFAQLARRQLA